MEELYVDKVIDLAKKLKKINLELSIAVGVLQCYATNPITEEMYQGLVKIVDSKEIQKIIYKENKTNEEIRIKDTYTLIKKRLEEIKPYLNPIELRLEF